MRRQRSRSRIASLIPALLLAAPLAICAREPRIHIVRGYEGMGRYAEAAVGADQKKRAALYDQLVNQPYRKSCSGEGDAFSMSRSTLQTPIADVQALRAAVAEVAGEHVEPRISEALRNATRLLPADEITVCLFVFPPDSPMASLVREKMSGLMGFNEAPRVFWLQVLPVAGWSAQIQYGAAHEFEHSMAYTASSAKVSLLEMLLAEGRADSFATLLYPERVPPWTRALTDDQERAVWEAMQPFLSSEDDGIIDKYVFGRPDDDVPLWAGYTIGYRIAQSYLQRNSGEPPQRWAALDARTLLAKSGYMEGIPPAEED
jgi:uncharacterized protein YjaZ